MTCSRSSKIIFKDSPKEVPSKSCKSWGHFFNQAVSCPGRVGLPAWNLNLWMRRTMVRFLHVCGIWCVLCASFVSLKSCVSCQALAQALQQNSTLTELHLGFNNIGPEGAKAWCLVGNGVMRGNGVKTLQKTQPCESDSREMPKGNAMQRWFSDAFIRLKFVMTSDWGRHVLARSWSKREQFITVLFPKQVTLSFWSNPALEWHPHRTDVVEAEIENGLCWWWLSQIVQEYYSGHRFVTWWSIESCAINDRPAAHHINDEPWTLAVSFDGWNLWWHVIGVGMYWPDPGWKEKQFITVLFPKQVTLSFSNSRSSN